MDTMKIRAVLAAARLGSLSKAAEEFSYTPSAFSHLLASFEESLCVRIFTRSAKGVTLTEEGKLLCPKFEEILQCEQEISDTVSACISEKSNELRIATYSSISRNYLSRFLKIFRERYPEVKLSIHVADNLEGWLKNGRADVIFADNMVLSKSEWTPITTDRYCAVAPMGMLGDRESITIEELYGYPHIFTDDEYLRTVFDKERFGELIYFRSEDDQAVINMVRSGMGIAVLPELVMQGNLSGVSVAELEPQITRTLGFAYKKGTNSISTSKFVRYIKSMI